MRAADMRRGVKLCRALLVSAICAVILITPVLSGISYGADSSPIYKVTFYQLSATSAGGAGSGNPVSVTYTGLTQFITDEGETAVNPGAVTCLGSGGGSQKFIGWYEFNAPDDRPYNFGAPVTGNLNLFARFSNAYLVTFLDGFGDPFLTKRVTPGDAVSRPTDGEMSLFTAPGNAHFDAAKGWMDKDGTQYVFEDAVNEDLTLSPSLVDDVSFVYFVSEGSQTPFLTVKTGTAASVPAAPTREGYAFSRWSATQGGPAFDWTTAITEDTTLYAVWTPLSVKYTVVVWREKKNIAGDAGTNPSNYEYVGKFTQTATVGTSTSGLVGSAASLVAGSAARQPTWAAYGFAASTSDNVLGNGATVLNVYYKRIVYTFSFTPYSRSYSATAKAAMKIGDTAYTDSNRYMFSAKYEQDVSAVWPVRPLAQFTIPGSTLNFQGWLPPGSSVTFVSKVISISADLLPSAGTSQTITANYITSGINVNLHYMFESTEGNMPGVVSYNGKYYVQDNTYSQSVFSPGSPFVLKEIEGMRALTSNALQKTASGFSTAAAGNALVEQYLFYDRIRYTISFDTLGGSTVPTVTDLLPGASLAAYKPSDPTRTGGGATWVFDGWYTDSDYTASFEFAHETATDVNLNLYAKWKQNPFTVSVYDGLANASLLGAYTRSQGEYAGDPTVGLAGVGVTVNYTVGETYPGKGEFLGWVIPIGPGEKAALPLELPMSGNISVYADWKPQTFTVTYEAGSASGIPPVDARTYQSGVSARVLEPSGSGSGGSLEPPAGQTFIGWLDGSGRTHYPGEMISVTKNIVLTANCALPYSVVVYVYHINYPADAEDSSGTPITDPGNLKQYVFPDEEFPVLSYSAYSPTPEPEGYRFAGWAASEDRAAAGMVDYKGGSRYPAAASGTLEMWGVWIQDFPVTFDAGVYGEMRSGATRITYQVRAGSTLDALGISVPDVEVSDVSYTFIGWALSDSWPSQMTENGILSASVDGPVTYRAVYSELSPPLSDTYYAVIFDAGGIYGNIAKKEDGTDSGAANITYQVKEGSSLTGSGLSVPGVKTTDADYTFIGWALSGDWPDTSGTDVILGASVTDVVTYQAVYGALPDGAPSAYYYEVTFDTGVYGKLSDETTSLAIAVKANTPLEEAPGFTMPAVMISSGFQDFTFVGWSPAVDMTSPVNEVRLYRAQYAYTPDGLSSSTTYHTVSFELGSQGVYKNETLTSFVVEEGTSLAQLDNRLFAASDFGSLNIQVLSDDFAFVGWSPTLDPTAPVYTDRVYRAQYAYEPSGLSHIEYTPLEVDEDPPETYTIQALGYEGYYDGAPHGVRYTVSGTTGLSNILSFWFDPSAAGLPLSESIQNPALSSGGIWAQGLPPDETGVTDEEVDLIFSADGKIPQEAIRRLVIKPRPLVPTAAHADIVAGAGIPLRETYSVAIAYDGKENDGTPIGDDFDFAAHESEFDKNGLQISTTYTQGDPAGSYPLYVKAGVYGNYEIYEGTEEAWPFFSGWRFAGVLQVKAQGGGTPGDNGGNNNGGNGDGGNNDGNDDDDDGNGGGDNNDGNNDDDGNNGGNNNGGGNDNGKTVLPAMGDTADPLLLSALLVGSLAGLAALTFCRRKRPAKQRKE